MSDSAVVECAITDAADLFPRGASVLVACSGGADSVALAAALARCADALGVRLAIGHVDHGLRIDSSRDAEAVRALAQRLDVPFHLACLEPLDTSRLGLEAAAREERYRALASLAQRAGADRVATAHTRRDQAETVLLRLARGGGPGALAGSSSASTSLAGNWLGAAFCSTCRAENLPKPSPAWRSSILL